MNGRSMERLRANQIALIGQTTTIEFRGAATRRPALDQVTAAAPAAAARVVPRRRCRRRRNYGAFLATAVVTCRRPQLGEQRSPLPCCTSPKKYPPPSCVRFVRFGGVDSRYLIPCTQYLETTVSSTYSWSTVRISMQPRLKANIGQRARRQTSQYRQNMIRGVNWCDDKKTTPATK